MKISAVATLILVPTMGAAFVAPAARTLGTSIVSYLDFRSSENENARGGSALWNVPVIEYPTHTTIFSLAGAEANDWKVCILHGEGGI